MKFKYKLQFKIQFLWYDFWIGFFFDKDKHKLYICPFPCIVLSFWLKPNYKNMSREEGINCLKKRVQQKLKNKIKQNKLCKETQNYTIQI